ncbi:MAG TPA: TetR/AcrR family transcriptional regulator [Jatrophihabitantaceae bacterium]|jgi:AcrR family transcriptional regulator
MPDKAHRAPAARSRATRSNKVAVVERPAEVNATRQRVIEAAIQCILEQGFYRASSNAIAERAGLSWGVIQYHFGSREALMLGVLQEGTGRLAHQLRAADIHGETLVERMEEYFDILAEYYESPDYLAFTQVLLNLSHDPTTSTETRKTMADIAVTADPELKRLVNKVFAGTGLRRQELKDLVFHSLRGIALSHVMVGALPAGSARGQEVHSPSQRKLMARALSLLIEEERGSGR